jgi:hypothetical protein
MIYFNDEWDKRDTKETKQSIYKTIKILYYMIQKYDILRIKQYYW